MEKEHSFAKLMTLIVPLVFGGMAISSSADKASYQSELLTIKNVKRMKDWSVQIVYQTMAESIWHCPGIRTKKIAEGVEVILREGKV